MTYNLMLTETVARAICGSRGNDPEQMVVPGVPLLIDGKSFTAVSQVGYPMVGYPIQLWQCEALDLEKAVIARIGINALTNFSEGHLSEEVRGLQETELAIEEHFSLSRWPEVRLMSPMRKKMWCEIRDRLLSIADGYRRLIDQRGLI